MNDELLWMDSPDKWCCRHFKLGHRKDFYKYFHHFICCQTDLSFFGTSVCGQSNYCVLVHTSAFWVKCVNACAKWKAVLVKSFLMVKHILQMCPSMQLVALPLCFGSPSLSESELGTKSSSESCWVTLKNKLSWVVTSQSYRGPESWL